MKNIIAILILATLLTGCEKSELQKEKEELEIELLTLEKELLRLKTLNTEFEIFLVREELVKKQNLHPMGSKYWRPSERNFINERKDFRLEKP